MEPAADAIRSLIRGHPRYTITCECTKGGEISLNRLKTLSPDELKEELTRQGLDVTVKGNGEFQVLGTDGIAHFHQSTLGKGRRHYLNVMTNLRRVGFDPPREQVSVEREPRGEHPCEDCDYVGPFARNLGRHQRSAGHGKFRREEGAPVIVPPVSAKKEKPRHKKEELRAKRLVKQIREGVTKLTEDADELVSLVEPMELENAEMRRKLARVEDILGKAVDSL